MRNLPCGGPQDFTFGLIEYDFKSRVSNCVPRFLKQFEAKRSEAMEHGNLL